MLQEASELPPFCTVGLGEIMFFPAEVVGNNLVCTIQCCASIIAYTSCPDLVLMLIAVVS
jgi:hypothetical protein